jgi:parvulin-like peptidyl-prolyl isomerase
MSPDGNLNHGWGVMGTKTALRIGDRHISLEQTLKQLHERQILPQLMQEIVVDELLARAEQDSQISLDYTPDEFDRLFKQVSAIGPFQGMNRQQLTKIAERTIKLQKFKQLGWGERVTSYFHQHERDLDKLTFSILQVPDGAIAQELFFRVQDGETSFAELARAYSVGQTAVNGGVVGPILARELHPSVRQTITGLEPGELTSLFQLDGTFGFIRLDAIEVAELNRSTYQFILDEFFDAWIQPTIALEIGAREEPIDLALAPCLTGDFSETPPPLTVDISTPEVTIVNEPRPDELLEDISTGFFLPDFPHIPTALNLPQPSAPAPADLDGGRVSMPPAPSEDAPVKGSPLFKLAGIAALGGISTLCCLSANYYQANGNISSAFPEPLRTWVRAVEPK